MRLAEQSRVWTAALLVIGDEILSGRTQDKNVAQVALWLNEQGIRLAEVRVPILENLELSGAIRYEYYGGGVGSTTNPRVSLRWQATDFLAFRGSAGTTFRAPQQRDLTPGNVRNLAQFNLPGVGSLYRPVDTANNPNLKPETADTYNVGAIVSVGNF